MGNVVEEFKLGDATIRICDDCCRGQTREESDEIIRDIEELFINYLQHKTA